MKGKFCLLPRLAIHGDHDAVPVVDPKYSPAHGGGEPRSAAVLPPLRPPARARRYFTAHLHLVSLTQLLLAQAPESLSTPLVA